MNKAAKIISAIFSPLLVPTYAMAILLFTSTMVVMVPVYMLIRVLMLSAIITCIIPFIAFVVLKKINVITDLDVTDRKQRPLPFLVLFICYIWFCVLLKVINCPAIIVSLMSGGALAVIVQSIINIWWKISGHACAIGAFTAMIFIEAITMSTVVNMFPIFLFIVLVGGLVGTSRLILHRHTLWQVIAGGAEGFVSVIVASLVF